MQKSDWKETGGLFREERLTQLGVVHGMTHRSLGNMKELAARKSALRAAGLIGDALTLHQLHGTLIHRGISCLEGAKGDGWVADAPGRCVGVFAADCLPIFIWSRNLKVVGVFHAGWRGLAAGMAKAAVDYFDRFEMGPADLSAAVGPHIGPCCYEVGAEFKSRFRAGSFVEGDGLKLNLGQEVVWQLVEAGMPRTRVSVSSDCTSCAKDKFFSFRRDGEKQNMLAFIQVPPQ